MNSDKDEQNGQVPLKAWIGFISLSGGTFMAVLDTQIVAGSLPVIGASLGSTLQEASWIQTAYMIAEVIMIPLAGWLSRSLSLRYLYAAACSLFTASSVLCAVSSSMEWMVTCRVLQGLCAGFMTPLLYQAIYVLFPPEKRSAATLFVVFIVSLAPVIGPALGGWITDTWSWRWLFLMNVVPGVLVTASVLGLVRGPKPQLNLLKLCDGYGIVLAALFLGPLEYVIGEGPDRDWFESSLIVFLTCVACTSALLFLWRQLACRHPLVDLRAFLYRNFSTGCLFNFAVGFGLFGSGYLMTMFLSGVKKYNSLQIGHVMAVPGAAMILSIPLVRMVRKHVGGSASLAIGLAMFTTALWLNSAMTSETGFDQLFVPQVLRGMGIMFTLSPITELALGTLPRDAVANATGLYTLMRSLGGGIGIAVINTLVDMRSRLHFLRLAETLTPARVAVTDYIDRIDASLATYLPEMENGQRGLRQVAGLVRREALIITCSEMWLVIAGVFFILFLLLPLVRKVRR